MYKDLKTMIIVGSTGTGKTRLISKYIEEIINEDNDIYIIDLKRVELFEYKDNDKVTYIEFMEDIENILNKIEKNNVFVACRMHVGRLFGRRKESEGTLGYVQYPFGHTRR